MPHFYAEKRQPRLKTVLVDGNTSLTTTNLLSLVHFFCFLIRRRDDDAKDDDDDDFAGGRTGRPKPPFWPGFRTLQCPQNHYDVPCKRPARKFAESVLIGHDEWIPNNSSIIQYPKLVVSNRQTNTLLHQYTNKQRHGELATARSRIGVRTSSNLFWRWTIVLPRKSDRQLRSERA